MRDEHPLAPDDHRPQKEDARPKGMALPDSLDPARFLFGFCGSIILSAILWFLFWDYFFGAGSHHALILVYVGVGKLVLAFGLIFLRESRALGIGILASLPVSGAIAYGACAVNVVGKMSGS